MKLCSLIIAINLCDFPRNELMNSFQQLISHMNGYSFIMINIYLDEYDLLLILILLESAGFNINLI